MGWPAARQWDPARRGVVSQPAEGAARAVPRGCRAEGRGLDERRRREPAERAEGSSQGAPSSSIRGPFVVDAWWTDYLLEIRSFAVDWWWFICEVLHLRAARCARRIRGAMQRRAGRAAHFARRLEGGAGAFVARPLEGDDVVSSVGPAGSFDSGVSLFFFFVPGNRVAQRGHKTHITGSTMFCRCAKVATSVGATPSAAARPSMHVRIVAKIAVPNA